MLASPSTSTYSRWMGQISLLNSGYKCVKDVRKASLFLNCFFLCVHWLYVDTYTQHPFCSLFLFTEGIQNKWSFICKIRSPEHQDVLHEASKTVHAVWKTTSPCNDLHIQPKIFTYVCWKVNVHLPISVTLGKKSQTADKSQWIWIFPSTHQFSAIHLKPLCELESHLGLSSCWYVCIHPVASDHCMKNRCFGGLGGLFGGLWVVWVFLFLVGLFQFNFLVHII